MSPYCGTQEMHFLNIPMPISGDLPPEEQVAPLSVENPLMERTVVESSRGRRRGDNHHRCRCPFPHTTHTRRDSMADSSDDENDSDDDEDDDHCHHHNDEDDRLSVLDEEEEEEVMRRTKVTTSEAARKTGMVSECLPWVQGVPNDITTDPTRQHHQHQQHQIHHHHYYHHYYQHHPVLPYQQLQHIPPTLPHLYHHHHHQQQQTITTTATTTSSSSSLHPYHQYHYHHQHHTHPAVTTTTNTSSRGSSSTLVARSVVPCSTPSSPAGEPTPASPCVTSTGPSHDTIPQSLRENAKQYILQQLQVNERRHTDMLEMVQKFITSLEDQVYRSVATQEQYISKLATRLAAILAHLPTRRYNAPGSKSTMGLHNASPPTFLRHHHHHSSSSSSPVPATTSDLQPVAVSTYSVSCRTPPSP